MVEEVKDTNKDSQKAEAVKGEKEAQTNKESNQKKSPKTGDTANAAAAAAGLFGSAIALGAALIRRVRR